MVCQGRVYLSIFKVEGFPGGSVVKNPPANAGDTGSSPGPRRSHMPRSNKARAPQLPKPVRLEPGVHNKRSHRSENPACTATKSGPRSLQLEKARAQQRRPNAAKNKLKKKIKWIIACIKLLWYLDSIGCMLKSEVTILFLNDIYNNQTWHSLQLSVWTIWNC